MSLSLITDRTAADIAYYTNQFTKIINKGWNSLNAAEQIEWTNASLKGGYWHTDLNRVGSAIQYLAGILTGLGYGIAVTARTNWTAADDLRVASAVAYLADLINIKSTVYGTTALPASLDYLGYKDANNIEMMLLEAESRLNAMPLTFNFAGYTFGGEDFSI